MIAAVPLAAGEGQLFGVDWGAFMLVFLVALAATTAIVFFYAVGLRLLAAGATEDSAPRSRSAAATVGAYACFAVGVAAVLYGIYLVVPQLHGG